MKKHLKFLFAFILAGAMLSALAQAPARRQNILNRSMNRGANRNAAQSAAPASSTTTSEPGGRSIEFNQTPVDLVFKVYGELTDKTVLKDPQAPSPTITLQPKQGQVLSDEDKIWAIETVLEMNGIHIEPYGDKFVRAIPRKDARKEGIPLIMDHEAELKESTRVVSMMIPLENIGVEDAQKTLDQFKSAAGIIIGFERTNKLLLTDTEANINRMREIVKAIDIATPVTEQVFVRQIKNASAMEIQEALQKIVEDALKEQEKNGKVPNGAAANQQRPSAINGLLRRNQQNNQPAPVNNESVVMSVSDADRGMIRGRVLIVPNERSNKLIFVTSKSNMDFFDKVIEALDIETTPDTVVKVFRLKYAEAEDVSDMINDLIGNAPSGKGSSKDNQNRNAKNGSGSNMTRGTAQTAKKSANQRSGEAKAGELSKENTVVLSDKRINGLVVMTDKELLPTIEGIIESMDIKLSQVLIETVIIEVTLGDGIEAGVDWIQKGRQSVPYNTGLAAADQKFQVWSNPTTDDDGNLVEGTYQGVDMTAGEFAATYGSDSTVSGFTLSDIATTATKVARDGALNYFSGGAASLAMGGGSGGGLGAAAAIATNVLNSFSGSGFNMVFNSDDLGIAAILKATQNDEHAKYLASPVVMTVDNKEATIDATTARQFITGWQSTSSSYAGSGMPTPTYTSKDIGIKVKVTPKINPNGTVMLNVEEEYNQVAGKQDMLVPTSGSTYGTQKIDVPTTRKMTSDVLLENMQTVVFGGLVESYEMESETGIPFLKDLPWVGKWLFGTTTKTETRTELLVFMTPYVLDDGAAAQAEAIRRKKTLSDARAWDDHGWSASKLADPVSKKEQMRRLKDEWEKQDEERRTKLAIEKAKIDRAKKLQELSVDERNLWLKMHKDELEKEQQEELEKKMLDKDSQEELKKLAADIRAKKLKEAQKELDEMEKQTAGQNERGRMDAEKAEKAKEAEESKKPERAEPEKKVEPEKKTE